MKDETANLLFCSTEIQKKKFSSEQRVYTKPVHYTYPICTKDLNSAMLLHLGHRRIIKTDQSKQV